MYRRVELRCPALSWVLQAIKLDSLRVVQHMHQWSAYDESQNPCGPSDGDGHSHSSTNSNHCSLESL